MGGVLNCKDYCISDTTQIIFNQLKDLGENVSLRTSCTYNMYISMYFTGTSSAFIR